MNRAMGDKFFAMAKYCSHGVLEGAFASALGESGSQFRKLKGVSGYWRVSALGFMVLRLEKRPPWTVGRFCEGFLWP